MEIPAWCEPDALVDDWVNVSISRDPEDYSKQMKCLRWIDREYPSNQCKNVAKNTYLFDFGQTWQVCQNKSNGSQGTEFVIKMNEKLKDDGTLDTVYNSGFTKTVNSRRISILKRVTERKPGNPDSYTTVSDMHK